MLNLLPYALAACLSLLVAGCGDFDDGASAGSENFSNSVSADVGGGQGNDGGGSLPSDAGDDSSPEPMDTDAIDTAESPDTGTSDTSEPDTDMPDTVDPGDTDQGDTAEDTSDDTGAPDDTDLSDTTEQDTDTEDTSDDTGEPEDTSGDTEEPDVEPDVPDEPDPLVMLNEEFDDATALAELQRVHEVEQWGADQLEAFSVEAGRLVMMPYTSSWYQDYRGVLAFKEIAGDFVITTQVAVSNRTGDGPPGSSYSLAGIMVRTPRDVTPETWAAGGENYMFLSIGAADVPGTYQTEVKTTRDSDSMLETGPGASEATIRVARVGAHAILLLRLPGEGWVVHRRYHRDDMPETLQVGFTVYTDWPSVSGYSPSDHNATQITGGSPDLIARFDYMRFMRPPVPAPLVDSDLSNPDAVSDAQLLEFLGASIE